MPRIVVIGAGIAGLACAQKLSKVSGMEVTILEATGAIGGRIKAVNLGSKQIDIGASWMHETRHNQLFQHALAEKWAMRFTDINPGQYTQKGPVPVSAGIEPILRELEAMIIEDFHLDDEKQEGSLKTYIENALKKMPLVSPEQKQLAALLYRQIEHFIGQPWEDIPTSEGADTACRGRDVFLTGKGYTQLIDFVRSESEQSQIEIKLNEPVQTCAQKGEQYEIVTAKHTYVADYVVCTIPLGVLKKDYKEIFQFPLPQRLLNTITQSNLANLGKVVVQFDKVFWDVERCSSFVIHTETGEPISVVAPYKDEPILVLLISGPLTFELESKPETALDRVKWVFDAIKTTKEVPEVTNVRVSDWSVNPNFLCSYSARAVRQDYDSMIQPFAEGVGHFRFAGEHVAMDGSGCVHGAYASGVREAEFILEIENQPEL